MACKYCRRIGIDETEHAPSFADLEINAQSCWICGLIKLTMESMRQVPYAESIDWPIRCRIVITWRFRQTSIEIIDARLKKPLRVYGVFVLTNRGDIAQTHGVPMRIQLTSTSSETSLLTAKRWISCCQLNHDCSSAIPSLRVQYESGHRPARMIDVHAFPAPSQDVRLVELDGSCEYVALSYCWGVEQFFVTSTKTLQSRLERISYTILPKTFQDAIEITRGLGYRFIWIDALCIIQDSVPDWEQESQKMGIVYSQAVVTIAATSSTSVRDGCFNRESISFLRHPQNHILTRSSENDGDPTGLLLFDDQGLSEVPMKKIEEGALTRRGWACQERILSPRILHYTTEQIFWECRKCFNDEEGIYERCISGIPTAPFIGFRFFTSAKVDDRIELWYREIVEKFYCARRLTRPSDRLPAVSSLARLIADGTNMTFLAGLWKEELHYGLWWGVVRRAPRCQSDGSPSWSWVSYDTQVSWIRNLGYRSERARFVLQDHGIELVGQDPYGSIKKAWLKLSGELCKVQVRICEERRHSFMHRRHILGDWSSELLDIHGRFLGDANLDRVPGAETVYALLLTAPVKYWELWTILLLTPASKDHDVFERIGVALIFHKNSDIKHKWRRDFEVRSITLV